jgi:CelD/BcsL family acetyltransferase involved in cellulose biosynthesis
MPDARAPRDIRFEILDGPKALAALGPQWNELSARAAVRNCSQTFYWAKHSLSYLASQSDARVRVIVGRHDGRVVLILPFVVRDRFIWRQADWLGVGLEYRDILVEEGFQRASWVVAAWEVAKAELDVDLIWCPSMRAESPLMEVLQHETGVAATRFPTRYLPIYQWPSWEAYRRDLRRGYRKNQKRLMRRLGERGKVAFEILASASEVEQTLHWMLAQKRDWFRRRGMGRDWQVSDSYERFITALARDALASGELMLAVLRLSGQNLAADINFVRGPHLELYMTAYDRAWKSFGPGLLALDEIIRWAFKKGLSTVDFRTGNELYKRHFLTNEELVSSFLVPCTESGARYTSWHGSAPRRLVRNAFHRLPPAYQLALKTRFKR